MKAIDAAKDLSKKEYTEDSWTKLSHVYNKAKTLIKNKNATQEEVNNVTKELNEAIESLVKAPESNVDSKPIGKPEIPSTEDQTKLIALGGSLGLALISILIIHKKKKSEEN